MPDAAGDRHVGADQGPTFSVKHLVEAESVAERTGAHHVVIGLILDPKRNARHSFHDPLDRLEARRQREIAHGVPFIDQQWKVLVGGVLRQLGQHRLPRNHFRARRDRRQQRRHLVHDDSPIPRFALARDCAAEVRRRLVLPHVAEIKVVLRRRNRQRQQHRRPEK